MTSVGRIEWIAHGIVQIPKRRGIGSRRQRRQQHGRCVDVRDASLHRLKGNRAAADVLKRVDRAEADHLSGGFQEHVSRG